MAINTLPVQFERNYKDSPFIGALFTSTVDLNAWLTNPTRYAGQPVTLVEGGVVSSFILNATEDAWVPSGNVVTPLWTPSTAYDTATIIIDGSNFKMYRANVAHTSDATDIANDITLGVLDQLAGIKVEGGTLGSVVFLGAAGELLEDPSQFTYDPILGRLSIGSNNTTSALLNLVGTGSSDSTINVDSYASNTVFDPTLRFRRAQGSEASPTRLQSGVEVGTWQLQAHYGTNFRTAGGITCTTVEDWATTRGSMKMEFKISPVGNTYDVITLSLLDDMSAIFEGAIKSKDKLLTLNYVGTQATAEGSGVIVEMSDATDANIIYDSTLDSKFKIGEVGSELEVGTIVKDTDANLVIFAATAVDGQKCFATDTKVEYIVIGGALTSAGGSGGSLSADIDVLDVSIGSYNNGDNIPAGTDFEVIFNGMLKKTIPPTYFSPTLSLSGSGTLNVEAGTLISATLTPTFNQNDAGPTNNYELFRQAVSIYVNGTELPHGATPFNIGDENIIFNADLDHDIGPIKNDNTGTPDPTGRILAGQITSNNVTYRGQRRLFYGIDGDIVNIRTNPLSFLNPSNGTSRSFSGSGNTVVFSYPDTLRDMTQASLTSSGFTFDILSEFTRVADQLVNDANGGNPINYKVFEYSPASAFTAADFVLTI